MVVTTSVGPAGEVETTFSPDWRTALERFTYLVQADPVRTATFTELSDVSGNTDGAIHSCGCNECSIRA